MIVSLQGMSADFNYLIGFVGNVPLAFTDKVDLNAPPGQGRDPHRLWFPTAKMVLKWGVESGEIGLGFTSIPRNS